MNGDKQNEVAIVSLWMICGHGSFKALGHACSTNWNLQARQDPMKSMDRSVAVDSVS